MFLNDDYGHGGDIYRLGRRLGLNPGDIIDFSASINPLGPSPAVLRVLKEDLWRVTYYPEPFGGEELKQLVAARMGVAPEQVVLGNGAAELIFHLPRVLGIRRALIVQPTFSEYAAAVLSCGGEVDNFLLSPPDFCLTADEVEQLVWRLARSFYDAVFLCNPNNPTGFLVKPELLRQLAAEVASRGAALIVDEAFIDFVEGREEYSLTPLVADGRVYVFYSLTKFFALPGLRVGAVVVPPGSAQHWWKGRDPWCVNALAQVAAVAALRDKEYELKTLAVIASERDYLWRELSQMDSLRVLKTAANFLLVEVGGAQGDASFLINGLARRGILVRDCSNFPGLSRAYIRLAVRRREENELLLAAVREQMSAGR